MHVTAEDDGPYIDAFDGPRNGDRRWEQLTPTRLIERPSIAKWLRSVDLLPEERNESVKHQVLVVGVQDVKKIEGSDRLGVTRIDDYDVVVGLEDFRPGSRGVFVEPDYVVPDLPLWTEILGRHRRIGARRLRGVMSAGLLLPLERVGLDPGTPVGTDVMAQLGIQRYVPPEECPGAVSAAAPKVAAGLVPYSLESWRAYRSFLDGSQVVVLREKLNGESARFVYSEGRMHAGSRTEWKRLDSTVPWAVALRANPWIESWCRFNPEKILYGEVVGNVPKTHYGVRQGQRGFYAFDVWHNGAWVSNDEFQELVEPPCRAPLIYLGPNESVSAEMAEGKSFLADHLREGFVLKTASEMSVAGVGRMALKCVGIGFHELISRRGGK